MTVSRETLEWIWTLPASVGFVVGLYLLWLVLGDDYYQTNHHGNEAERIWSRSQVWQKLERVTVLAIMVLFGLVSILTPTSNASPPGRVAYALTVTFVLIPTVLTAGALRTLIDRRRILSAIRRGEHLRRRVTDLSPRLPAGKDGEA